MPVDITTDNWVFFIFYTKCFSNFQSFNSNQTIKMQFEEIFGHILEWLLTLALDYHREHTLVNFSLS